MTITKDTLTIAGNIGNDPIKNETRAGKPVVNFRVGSSSGYFDQRTGAWADSGTNWYAVAAYGNLAEHAKASLRRGDPVIVTGRLKVREWEANGKKGIDVEIVADAIGHDLNSGTSAFVRRPRASAAETTDGGPTAGGAPRSDGSSVPDEPTAAEQDAWRAIGLIDPDAAADGETPAEDREPTEELSHA